MDSLRFLCHRHRIGAVPGLYTLKRSASSKCVSLRLSISLSPWVLSGTSVNHLACYRLFGTSLEVHMSDPWIACTYFQSNESALPSTRA